jgi:hypothetical protein
MKLFNKPRLDWKLITNKSDDYQRWEARFFTNLFSINFTDEYVKLRFEGEFLNAFKSGEIDQAKSTALEYCRELIINNTEGIELPEGYSLTAIGHKEIINQGYVCE